MIGGAPRSGSGLCSWVHAPAWGLNSPRPDGTRSIAFTDADLVETEVPLLLAWGVFRYGLTFRLAAVQPWRS